MSLCVTPTHLTAVGLVVGELLDKIAGNSFTGGEEMFATWARALGGYLVSTTSNVHRMHLP
jgi:hypothetical protein